MTRPERSARIKKLKALYRKERCGLAECVGNEWATAYERNRPMKASKAERPEHEIVTTVSKHGSLGIGRLIGNDVWKNQGNGHYELARNMPGGLATYHQDGGSKYLHAVEAVFADVPVRDR